MCRHHFKEYLILMMKGMISSQLFWSKLYIWLWNTLSVSICHIRTSLGFFFKVGLISGYSDSKWGLRSKNPISRCSSIGTLLIHHWNPPGPNPRTPLSCETRVSYSAADSSLILTIREEASPRIKTSIQPHISLTNLHNKNTCSEILHSK